MNSLSLIFSYYKNPLMLEYQWRIWEQYPDHVEVVLVDDGSPVGLRAEEVVARMPPLKCRFKLLRILVDLPWNQCGARNLGVSYATGKWGITVDIDHIVSLECLIGIENSDLDEFAIYSLGRMDHFSRLNKTPHWESRLMTRQMFWDVGGFDEAYCGHYGFPERDWLDRVSVVVNKSLPLCLERVSDHEIADAKTQGLVRKEGRDEAAFKQIKKWKKERHIPIRILNLPWIVVSNP